MLSTQRCTNKAAIHRRQRSTPALPTLNQPVYLPATAPNYQHSGSLSPARIDRLFYKGDDAQEGYHQKQTEERQQCKRQPLQETQQPDVRSGTFVMQHDNTLEVTKQYLELSHGPASEHGMISHDDINALLMGLHSQGKTNTQHYETSTIDPSQAQGSRYLAMNGVAPATPFQPYAPSVNGGMKQGNVADFPSTPSSFSTSRNEMQRPQTPPNQTYSYRQTKSPSTMPVHRQTKKKEPNLTIQASVAMQRGRSLQDNVGMTKGQSIKIEPLSPPMTAPLNRHSLDFEILPSPTFPSLSDLRKEMPLGRGGYDPAVYSPLTNIDPLNTTVLQPPSDGSRVSLFESPDVDNAVFEAQLSYIQATQGSLDLSEGSSPTLSARHSRNQSVNDIDVEDCIQETGITAEEIASFIQGPFPEDQKWSCLFEDSSGKQCGKRFARKENAKSHVQTHLGDRQYVCNVCHTRFVRQHDLKRHYRIHTTEKSFRCPCGKDFHRQDALTRHRQRGMCVGSFNDSPKKNGKRGRPKKARPSNTERSEKAARTRQYILERTKPGSTYASSISGSSEYSHPSPPAFDNNSVTASSPSISHKDFEVFAFTTPSPSPLTPPASPQRSPIKTCASPFGERTLTPKPSRSPSPRLNSIPEDKQMAGDNGHLLQVYDHSSPPELDPSSSSPATSNIIDFNGCHDMNSDPQSKTFSPDCLNPQVLNRDFQLFDGTSDESSPGVQFEDFIDFGNDDPGIEKRNERAFFSGPMLDAGSYTIAPASDMEDPFDEL